MDQYVVYINADPTKDVFPYTVNGFVDALDEAREIQKKTAFRLDVVHVVNPNNVDLGCPYGLTDNEIDIAHAIGHEEYV